MPPKQRMICRLFISIIIMTCTSRFCRPTNACLLVISVFKCQHVDLCTKGLNNLMQHNLLTFLTCSNIQTARDIMNFFKTISLVLAFSVTLPAPRPVLRCFFSSNAPIPFIVSRAWFLWNHAITPCYHPSPVYMYVMSNFLWVKIRLYCISFILLM